LILSQTLKGQFKGILQILRLRGLPFKDFTQTNKQMSEQTKHFRGWSSQTEKGM
jgi:hypothetical protein